MAGSVWDQVLDTGHAVVVRTYIEQWPRKNRAPEKVLIIVVEPDEEHAVPVPAVRAARQARRARRGAVADPGRARQADVPGIGAAADSAASTARSPRRCRGRAMMTGSAGRLRSSRLEAAHMAWMRAAAELRITWEALAGITARVAAGGTVGWTGCGAAPGSGFHEKPGVRARTTIIITDHDRGRIAKIGDSAAARPPPACVLRG